MLSKKSGQKGEGKQINKTKVGKFDQTNRMLVQRIKAIKGKHPFWGYRRVRAWLRYREGIKVNQKRIYKLMKENGLLVERKIYKAKRRPTRSKPKKEEVIWLHEFTSLTEAKEVIRDWIAKYNREYVHSALGYLSPLEFEQKFYQNYCQGGCLMTSTLKWAKICPPWRGSLQNHD
ncbi:HTH-like domain protein [Candidatus Methanoperedenaceae archaeon GB37]|nr:HTH-like domain protein [Candidatus Methanoperedenaceae archaeon GB37]